VTAHDDRISRARVSERAGVSAEMVDRLVELRILKPDDDDRLGPADVFRIRLVEACERAGIPAETVAVALADGRVSLAFMDLPQYRWATLATETYGELAERLHLPLDLIQDVNAALGSGRPGPDDRVREDDEAIYELVRLTAPSVDADALARIARVYADGLRRIAEAETTVFDTYVVGGLMRTGMGYAQAMERASLAGAEMAPQQERMIVALYRRQQERWWTEGFVEGIERVVEEMGLSRGPERSRWCSALRRSDCRPTRGSPPGAW
jgi:hypothetical protein